MVEKNPRRAARPDPSRRADARLGTPAPLFLLATPWGVEVGLASCLAHGPAIVEFIRGTWDPDARRRLAELASRREEIEAVGCRLLVITCEEAGAVLRRLEEDPVPLTILCDEDRAAARSYGVLRRFALPVWNVARPSTFVVDRCGFFRYRYLAPLTIRAAPLDEVLAAARAAAQEPTGNR
jgi:peroxiredoxin